MPHKWRLLLLLLLLLSDTRILNIQSFSVLITCRMYAHRPYYHSATDWFCLTKEATIAIKCRCTKLLVINTYGSIILYYAAAFIVEVCCPSKYSIWLHGNTVRKCLQHVAVYFIRLIYFCMTSLDNKQILTWQNSFSISLTELQNVCESLEGCQFLREVHLTGNPLQQESGWRYGEVWMEELKQITWATVSQELDIFVI